MENQCLRECKFRKNRQDIKVTKTPKSKCVLEMGKVEFFKKLTEMEERKINI